MEDGVVCRAGGLPFVAGYVEVGCGLCEDRALDLDQKAVWSAADDPGKDVVAGGVGFEGLPEWINADPVPLVMEAEALAEAANGEQLMLRFGAGGDSQAVPPLHGAVVGAVEEARVLKALACLGWELGGGFAPAAATAGRTMVA